MTMCYTNLRFVIIIIIIVKRTRHSTFWEMFANFDEQVYDVALNKLCFFRNLILVIKYIRLYFTNR